MSDAPFTLNTLLGLPDKDFCEQLVNAGSDAEETGSMKDHVSKALHGLQWKVVQGEVRKKAGGLLEMNVIDLIAAAWRSNKVMDKLNEDSKDKEKDGSACVPLAKHKISSELEPYIEIQLGNFKKKITLHVVLEMTLNGVVLRIEDALIHAIEAGFAEGSAEIRIEKISLPKRSFGPVELPAKVKLEKGIRLA